MFVCTKCRLQTPDVLAFQNREWGMPCVQCPAWGCSGVSTAKDLNEFAKAHPEHANTVAGLLRLLASFPTLKRRDPNVFADGKRVFPHRNRAEMPDGTIRDTRTWELIGRRKRTRRTSKA